MVRTTETLGTAFIRALDAPFSETSLQNLPGVAEQIAGRLLEAGDVVGAKEQINTEAEPEAEFFRSAGGGDAFVVSRARL